MSATQTPQLLNDVIQKYWGYDSFRPLQQPAMQAVLDNRDSVVVLPTGGGKSLCFQAPAVCKPGLAVVVSPLISLMKDQVDALTSCGVPAACVNSTHTASERRQVVDEIHNGNLKLLYVAPERLVMRRTIVFLQSIDLSFIAIDEAHCISEWGHDFRPEFRELKMLKQEFPGIALHAYTATATPQVRADISDQLGQTDPEVLIGSFDRPNLNYQVERQQDRMGQIINVLNRHKDESGIVYCISRKNVDEISATLNTKGFNTLPYHAGLDAVVRKRTQEAFIQEKIDIIVATVAFGMGIDKSNVRFVVHAGMPKSLEAYQQESGRAGRDGLEADCCLFYSGADFNLWKRLLGELEGTAYEAAIDSLSAMYNFCTGVQCRHSALVSYFGQTLAEKTCKACDVCLDGLDLIDDPQIVAQKIISCVVRLNQRFGGEYTAMVLAGSNDKRILEMNHDKLSTYGLLADAGKRSIRDWIEQLVGQGYLEKYGDYNTLSLTESGNNLLRGSGEPKLLKPRPQKKTERTRSKSSTVSTEAWEGVDRSLFDELRELRREKAEEISVPAYIVFGDAALREMAKLRPVTKEQFREVKGVGEKKLQVYADDFIECIKSYCRENSEGE